MYCTWPDKARRVVSRDVFIADVLSAFASADVTAVDSDQRGVIEVTM